MMLIACALGRSEIEGLGVFATEAIPRGTEVWRFDPVFDLSIGARDLDAAPEPLRALYARFAYELEGHPGRMLLDGDDGRFMNHSEAPNLDFSRAGTATASRDIAAGEELTCDYAHLASRPFEMEAARPGF